MPLKSKMTVRVTGIPRETHRGEFDKFVQHLYSLSTQKTSLISRFRTSSKAESCLGATQQEVNVTGATSDAGSVQAEGAHLVQAERAVQIRNIVGTSLSVQNEACLGTISFISETLKDKAIKQHSKEPSSLWKTWEVTDDFGYLTVLYDYGFEGEDGEAEVDICAVHGLGGNAMDTWTAKENNTMWLRDVLPTTTYFKKSRIMTFGYDSDMRAKGTVMNMEDWAQTLLTSVNSVRMSEKEKVRPILFVCHSLGGLVGRKAMVRLPKAINCPGIRLERCGLLFLSTPHTGCGSADWNQFLVALAVTIADVRQDTINLLRSFNPTSVWDKKDFEDLEPHPPIKCFAEGRTTKIKGTEQYIVTQSSATLDTKQPAEMLMGFDHSSICKFSSSQAALRIIMELKILLMHVQGPGAATTTEFQYLPGHPRFVAHAYPPNKGHWWQGNCVNQLMQRVTTESSCFGRNKELEALEKYAAEAKRRPRLTSIKGIGGIGKTEVLSEFAVQQKASRNIFFVRARNLDTFESLLGKIATDIGFDMLENKQLNWKVWQALSLSERLKTFYDWLGKECNRGSLLIIDDLDAFNDADIQKALHCEAHHVIVSTRNSILRLSPRERYSNDVPISRMDDEDLISIMRESGLDEELELFTEKDLQAIATLCHGHPFAASLVVPFVVEHLTSYDDPAKELVRRFKSSDPHARQTFLNFKLGGMSGSLWSSFEKSFALLHGESSPAATLFGFLSFLETSSDSIFLFLGQEKSRKGRVGQSLPDALVLEADFETDVATWLETLRKVSLYVFEPFLSSRKTINFHPFVLDFAQLRLGSDGRIRIIQQIFIFCCEAVKTSKASGYFILPQVYHCLAICRGFGIDLKTLSLPDHVWQWLQGFEFQNPFEPPEHILEDEATVGAEENVVDEKMVRDHITLCVQERKWFEEVENMISKHGLSDGCDARIVHLLKSHSRLVQHLEHFPETLAFLPGLENATDDLIWIITLTRRSGRISYPDLFHRLDIFKRRLHRGKCEAE